MKQREESGKILYEKGGWLRSDLFVISSSAQIPIPQANFARRLTSLRTLQSCSPRSDRILFTGLSVTHELLSFSSCSPTILRSFTASRQILGKASNHTAYFGILHLSLCSQVPMRRRGWNQWTISGQKFWGIWRRPCTSWRRLSGHRTPSRYRPLVTAATKRSEKAQGYSSRNEPLHPYSAFPPAPFLRQPTPLVVAVDGGSGMLLVNVFPHYVYVFLSTLWARQE